MTINVFKIINIIFDNIFFDNTKTFNFNARVFSNNFIIFDRVFSFNNSNIVVVAISDKLAWPRSFLAYNSLCSQISSARSSPNLLGLGKTG